jgi:5-methylcytosine-specific restriction endonuclease McrA
MKRVSNGWVKHSEVPNIESIGDWLEQDAPIEQRPHREPVYDHNGKQTAMIDREQYRVYLLSDSWKRRRDKVMKRANNICEGCLTNAATDVHHLSYKNIYNEFAFELIALCNRCHKRIHDKGQI